MITIPTLSTLYQGILTDLQTQYGVTIPLVGKVFLRAMAGVQAAKLKLYYLAIASLQKNIFVDTADPESLGGTLERFGRVKLNRNPFPATAGQYSIRVNGTIGAVIPASTTFKSDDTSLNPGMLFILDNAFTLITGIDLITVRALTSGDASKLNINDTLTATSPIAQVNNGAVVISTVVQPLNAEDIEAYRQKVINSYQLSPQGGSAVDYRLWSQDASGVERVYPYASNGNINQIDLYVEATTASSTDGKGTPSASTLLAVQEVIEFNPNTSLPLLERGRRPLGVWQVNYFPVTIYTIQIEITNYIGLTTPIQNLITSAIVDAINDIRPFVSAADILANKNDILDVNKIIGAIIAAKPGSIFTSAIIKVNGNPLLTYTFVLGNIPYINPTTGVTFT